ncbi:MAG: carboxypeptidase-like regulatory domain-containing protein, partial [Saprospiraceae bacterium]
MKFNLNLKPGVIAFLLLLSMGMSAQKGILSGKIFDKASGETLIGAILEVRKDGIHVVGAATDFDGNYHVELEPANYAVSINYLSYAQYTIADIIIKPKEVFTLEVALESEAVTLGEIVVKAEAVRSTEVALIALQRNASGIQDGVSSQQISRTGGSNAADAIRQMPAAVIQDGKYIVVRGL